ncbi:MAG: chemotaxis protein CheW [bacterium]
MRLLCFTVDDHRYGIASDVVVEIVRAVAVTPLPGSTSVIAGVIDVRGTIVPVFDLRARFTGTTRAVDPADHFILARTPSRTAALHVDRVQDLVDVEEESASGIQAQVPTAQYLAGAVTLPDGMVFIHDVARFLSSAEADVLESALAAQATPAPAPHA